MIWDPRQLAGNSTGCSTEVQAYKTDIAKTPHYWPFVDTLYGNLLLDNRRDISIPTSITV